MPKPPIFLPITKKERIAEYLIDKADAAYSQHDLLFAIIWTMIALRFASMKQVEFWDEYEAHLCEE